MTLFTPRGGHCVISFLTTFVNFRREVADPNPGMINMVLALANIDVTVFVLPAVIAQPHPTRHLTVLFATFLRAFESVLSYGTKTSSSEFFHTRRCDLQEEIRTRF